MKNLTTKKAPEPCLIERNGSVCEAMTDGARIETRCGVVAKNVSWASTTFKMVKVGHHDVTCPECKSINEIISEDVKE